MKPARLPADLVAYVCEQFGFTDADEVELVRGASFADLCRAHAAEEQSTVRPDAVTQ